MNHGNFVDNSYLSSSSYSALGATLCPCEDAEEQFAMEHVYTSSSSSMMDDNDSLLSSSYYHANNNINPNNNERFLQDNYTTTTTNNNQGQLWQIIYVSLVLLSMFIALISDAIGADMVMISALTLLMAANIISVEEGIAGFANRGLLTILILFVVAAGISHTGALDWYMGKLLGRPKNATSAQLRLMIPIAVISAFLNNTPVVVVMIPIVQRWGKNVGVSPQQLLMPLSFASILGGTCTLIGTSTNLVVVGLLQNRYPGDDIANVSLFDLGTYGVPIAFAGMLYVILFSNFLIPGGNKFIGARTEENSAEVPTDIDESILLGARLTKWSAAVNRTVKRSGLHDTAGLYLVNVHRAATGNVHRAVGQDFVLNVGDILYFTGLVEGFGKFCEDNGLEVITNEIEETVHNEMAQSPEECKEEEMNENNLISTGTLKSNDEMSPLYEDSTANFQRVELGIKNRLSIIPEVDTEIGATKESLLQSDYAERQRYINRLQDTIRGIPIADRIGGSKFAKGASEPSRIVAVSDKEDQQMVLVGVNAQDRPGLLLDISKTLIGMGLNLHRTEAMVIEGRSLSLWRCEVLDDGVSDIEDIWSALNAMLETNSGIEAIKRRGIRVVRAVIPKFSRLVDVTATDVNFRERYKCAIIAVQRNGKNPSERLAQTVFAVGDILVLQASDDSPLLIPPPQDYYKNAGGKGMPRTFSNNSIAKFVRKRFGSHGSLDSMVNTSDDGSMDDLKNNRVVLDMKNMDDQKDVDAVGDGNSTGSFVIPNDEEANANKYKMTEAVWKDLAVIFPFKKSDLQEIDETDATPTNREFLTAMEILPKSGLTGQTVKQLGLNKLPGLFLVSIERPVKEAEISSFTFANEPDDEVQRIQDLNSPSESNNNRENLSRRSTTNAIRRPSLESYNSSIAKSELPMITIQHDIPLDDGDILWFSGTAAAVGDLRKIPGMKSYVNKEVKKINEKVHDRRLVQAVIARRAKLVGKTIKQIKFRTRFGAAVIAVHREGKRVQEHPGDVKLQAGDVLLLEAGPTFVRQNADNDKSFSLLSEVENSSPPRLKLLIPALTIAVAMLLVHMFANISLLVCALVASMLMIAFGILSQQEARDAINWEIYVTIASAFGIGTALTNSGVAGGIADGLVSLGQALGIGSAGLFGAVYFATFLISNVVTNNAAAALLFPIAMDAAETTGADRQLMSYILMLGASASFMSPYGYTTNLLIYGPGGYKYVDFLRLGTPMQLVLWILSVVFVSIPASKWYLSWIFTLTGLVVVSFILTMGSSITTTCSRIASSIFSRCSKKHLSKEMEQLEPQ